MNATAIPTPRTEYLSCAQTATLVRAQLKKHFPGVKFSVKSSSYAGGASIRVRYESNSVWSKNVRAVTDQFVGSGFDGMIDMAYHRTHFLNADGTADLAHDAGTESSRGSVPERFGDAKPGAVKVSFGADHIFVENEFRAPECARCIEWNIGYRCDHYWEGQA